MSSDLNARVDHAFSLYKEGRIKEALELAEEGKLEAEREGNEVAAGIAAYVIEKGREAQAETVVSASTPEARELAASIAAAHDAQRDLEDAIVDQESDETIHAGRLRRDAAWVEVMQLKHKYGDDLYNAIASSIPSLEDRPYQIVQLDETTLDDLAARTANIAVRALRAAQTADALQEAVERAAVRDFDDSVARLWDESALADDEFSALHDAYLSHRAELQTALSLLDDAQLSERRERIATAFMSGEYGVEVSRLPAGRQGGYAELCGSYCFDSFLVGRLGFEPAEAAALRKAVIHVKPQPIIRHIALDEAIALKELLVEIDVRAEIVETPPRGIATKRTAIPEHVRHEVWRRDQGQCVDCGSRERLEFDHIVPLSKGGSNSARNIELRCESCNRRKAART